MDEEWRPAPGLEGWYEVSNLGRVRRSRGGQRTRVGLILKQRIDAHGYAVVSPCVQGRQQPVKVHRLVAGAFLGPLSDRLDVNHIDGLKSHNTPDNLEYATRKENIAHSHRMGLQPIRQGTDKPMAKLTDDDVREIRTLFGTLSHRAIAARFGVAYGLISGIRTGRRWSHVT